MLRCRAMHPNAALINTFYTCFQNRDAAGMIACYHPDVHFTDPVFQDLHGAEAGGMWRMLTARATSLQVSFSDIQADEGRGSARWEAVYPFSETGRIVHNRIRAEFRFRDGKIIEHRDHFDLWAWMRMALGLKGVLLGWLPPVHAALRKKARKGLDHFLRANP